MVFDYLKLNLKKMKNYYNTKGSQNQKGLKIAIDCFSLSGSKLTGVPLMIINIINVLQNIDSINEYCLLFKGVNTSIAIKNTKWSVVEKFKLFISIRNYLSRKKNNVFVGKLFSILDTSMKYVNFVLFYIYQILCPYLLRLKGFDVYVVTSSNYMIYSKMKKPWIILFFYDLVWKFYPETMEWQNKILLKLFAKINTKSADCLIAISESTRNDVMTVIKTDKPIIVMPLAADKNIFYRASSLDIQRVKKKYGIRNKYLLSVCTIEPRKNLVSLLKAFSMMKNINIQLVLTGKIGWINNEFFKEINELDIAERIIFTDYVPAEDLAPLYSGAEIFIYPSIYEGFGLPILEAFQCGVPVITSIYSAMPEVAGESALLVDTKDPKEIYNAITYLLKKASLRKVLIKRGFQRAEKYSWENSARILMETIEKQRNILR